MSLHLLATEGSARGTEFEVERSPTLIGRHPSVEVMLSGEGCAPIHAEILSKGDRWELVDLESPRGSYLNGVRVTRNVLRPGDEIRIGDHVLLVEGRPQKGAGDGEPGLLVGSSPAMMQVHRFLELVGPVDAPVLITGESGTGKEVVARALHKSSSRREKPLVITNCACLEGALVESELFGHERGAFTGAHARRVGRIEQAAQGTLFLDEIGELPLTAQAKFLRVLEGHPFTRLAGVDEIVPQVRVVAATNRDLAGMVREGTFREDLLFRLRVVELRLPPLRERLADLPELVDHFLHTIRRKQPTRLRRLSKAALAHLLSYEFPGNVRELKNMLERAAILSQQEVGGPELFSVRAFAPVSLVGSGVQMPAPDEPFPTLAQMERRMVVAALERSSGNKSQAARLLGVHRATLYNMLNRHGIEGR